MKNIAVILGTSVFSLFIIHVSLAQNEIRYDHSYSVSNYKQPHKARIARELNLDNSIATKYESEVNSGNVMENQNNYKVAPTKNRSCNGAILESKIVSKNTNCLEAEGNYKTMGGRKR